MLLQDLSHDDEIAKAYMADPLVKQMGTIKGVNDMLNTVGDSLDGYSTADPLFRVSCW